MLRLPNALLQKASLRGNEYAWLLRDIPEVIDTAEQLGLINQGGQLQFRIPNATFEAYEIEVDCFHIKDCAKAATSSRDAFYAIISKHDFRARARNWKILREFEEHGGDLKNHTYFVWYLAEA
jgi:hypothetical protein